MMPCPIAESRADQHLVDSDDDAAIERQVATQQCLPGACERVIVPVRRCSDRCRLSHTTPSAEVPNWAVCDVRASWCYALWTRAVRSSRRGEERSTSHDISLRSSLQSRQAPHVRHVGV